MLDALMEAYSDLLETWAEWWEPLFDLWSPFKPADGIIY